MTWVNVAVVAATAVVGVVQNQQAGDAAEKNQNRLSSQNRNNAITSQMYGNRGANAQLRQSEDVNADEELELQIQALQAESDLQLRDNGVRGVSIDRQHDAVASALSKSISQLDSNTDNARTQLEMDKKAGAAQATGRINSMPIVKNLYDPTADIVKGGLQIYGAYQSGEAKKKAADVPDSSSSQGAFGG